MDEKMDRGRRLIVGIIVATLTLSVLVIVLFNLGQGPGRLPQQIVRLLMTIGLCVFLYRGANWARWVCALLFSLGGLVSLVAGLATLSISMLGVLPLTMGLIYLASAVILIFVPAVRAYFEGARVETT